MSGFGPSRHFAAKQRFSRFRREADIKWQVGPAGSVENDPERTTIAWARLGHFSSVPLRQGQRLDRRAFFDLNEQLVSLVRREIARVLVHDAAPAPDSLFVTQALSHDLVPFHFDHLPIQLI
jgi:hypothetical protein